MLRVIHHPPPPGQRASADRWLPLLLSVPLGLSATLALPVAIALPELYQRLLDANPAFRAPFLGAGVAELVNILGVFSGFAAAAIVENLRVNGADPRYRGSWLSSCGIHIFVLVLLPMLLQLIGCVENYRVPFGSGKAGTGDPVVALVKMVKPKKKEKKKYIVRPDAALYFHVPDLDESEIMQKVEEVTQLTYKVDPSTRTGRGGRGGKMGRGGGDQGGWPEGMKNGVVRFIRLEYKGPGWDDGMDELERADMNFLAEFKKITGFRVASKSESHPIRLLKKYDKGFAPPFVYMTGDGSISIPPEDIKILREYLLDGGMLFADCGSPAWDRSFRALAQGLFPAEPLRNIAAGIDRQKQLRAKLAAEANDKAAKIRFAEDAPSDHLDMAGVRDASQLDQYEAAALGAEADKYDYRRRGKQQRAVSTAAATSTTATVHAPAVEAKQARTMLEPDVVNANRLDRFNLFVARLAFWLALGLVSFDYLSRFNRTRDHLWPKRLGTWFRSATPETLRAYLENLVRKGENFILCSPVDPWADAVALPRLVLRDWAWWPRWKLVCGQDDKRHDDEFLFEAAWFQRYAVVITERARAEQALRRFAELLAMRQRTGARARKTVHLVWAEPAPPSPEMLERLLQLCPGANLKLVLASPGSPLPENRFAEVL